MFVCFALYSVKFVPVISLIKKHPTVCRPRSRWNLVRDWPVFVVTASSPDPHGTGVGFVNLQMTVVVFHSLNYDSKLQATAVDFFCIMCPFIFRGEEMPINRGWDERGTSMVAWYGEYRTLELYMLVWCANNRHFTGAKLYESLLLMFSCVHFHHQNYKYIW